VEVTSVTGGDDDLALVRGGVDGGEEGVDGGAERDGDGAGGVDGAVGRDDVDGDGVAMGGVTGPWRT
jgi:hypothetical protein